MFEELSKDQLKWLYVYFPVSWLTQFGHGLVTMVVGPTQPYLAQNTGVELDAINFVWTFGFLGFLIGSVVAGFVFKRWVKSARAKLYFLGSTIFATGLFMVVIPFTSSFTILVIARLIQNISLGMFITADASIIVYLIGPNKSRAFTNALHAVIGVGFLVATFLVRPFLPEDKGKSQDDICNVKMFNNGTNLNDTATPLPSMASSISWPFVISGSWCVVFSLGFVALAYLPFQMPVYSSEDVDGANKDQEETGLRQGKASQVTLKFHKSFCFSLFLYYVISCGIERICQPMAFTFSLCGPLKLPPKSAVITDSFYNGGFMAGRIVSAIIGSYVRPRNMIISSLCASLLSAFLLVGLANQSAYGLYIGMGIMGFFVSWQFGSCFSWAAKRIDVTGRLSSIFFIGCGAGSLATPPVSGYMFTSSLGPMAVIYLILAFCLIQCAMFLFLLVLSKYKTNATVPVELKVASSDTVACQ